MSLFGVKLDLKYFLFISECRDEHFCCEISKKCIPNSFVCDGKYDCDDHDNSDERTDCGKF